MFSLKKVNTALMIGILFFVIISIFFNFIFVPEARGYATSINEKATNISSSVLELDLPIRVLANISSQIEDDSSKLENENIVMAYKSNLEKIATISKQISTDMRAMYSDLDQVRKISIISNAPLVDRILNDLMSTDAAAKQLLNLTNVARLENIPITEFLDQQAVLLDERTLLADASTDLNHQMLRNFTIITNIQHLSTLIILLLLSLGIYKYVHYDQRYIMESFQQMASKNYDIKSLPKYKPFFKEDYLIEDMVKGIYEEEAFVQGVMEMVESTYHIDDLMEKLFISLQEVKGIDRIGIAFVDYENQKFIAEHGITSLSKILIGPGFETKFHRTSLTKILEDKKPRINNHLLYEFEDRPTSIPLRFIIEEGVRSNMQIPLLQNDMVFGVVFFSSKNPDFFTEDHLKIAEKTIHEITGLLNRAYFTKVILSKITTSFAELVDRKDNETGGHINRMVAYSTLIASSLKEQNIPGYEVTNKYVMEIERNASSHDIGKVGIPDEILKKPGKLNPDEWVIMKTHSNIGGDIFKALREGLHVFDSDFYRHAEEIARYHHERYDGSGYPEGLLGQSIPLSARIVAIADVFDALTSKRHYKPRFTIEESFKIIIESKGSHLDPVLVDVFLSQEEQIRDIAGHKSSS